MTARPFERIFAPEDQRAFAQLSGDANSLHVDPVAAQRTPFGTAHALPLPRLPRLRTDQTLGFLGERAPEPQQVILSALRRMLRPDV